MKGANMTYKQKQAKARAIAIKWQQQASEKNRDFSYFIRWAGVFNRIAHKYGLVKEFRENAII